MKERRPAQSRQDKPVVRERGALARLLGIGGALASAALLALGLSVLIECLGIYLGWWPSDHAMSLLMTERAYIEAIDRYPLTALTPQHVSDTAAREFDSVWRSLVAPGRLTEYGVACIHTVKLIVLRLSICLFVLPGFALIALVAFFDGLVARDMRKYTGGHESSYVFHKAKRWIVPSLMLTISVFLMLPFSVRPVVIFAPSMLFTGLMIYVATSRFKKFL